MEKDAQVPVGVLRTDGGMVENELLMQFQSDILDREVVRPLVKETTALGAAYAAGLAVGFYAGLDDLRAQWSVDRTWRPQMGAERREKMYAFWKKAVTRSFDWLGDEPLAGRQGASGAETDTGKGAAPSERITGE